LANSGWQGERAGGPEKLGSKMHCCCTHERVVVDLS
jgi:hypothetical protein